MVMSSLILEQATETSVVSLPTASLEEPSNVSKQVVAPSRANNRKRRAAAQLSRIDLSLAGRLSGSSESLNSNSTSGNNDDDSASNSGDTSSDDDEKRSRFISLSSASNEEYDLAEIECSQGSTSARAVPLASGGLRIGNGEYELVGDGCECKAVHIQEQSVYHCQILKTEKYNTFLTIVHRLQSVESSYEANEFQELKQLILPDGMKTIPGANGVWYLLSPDHQGNLHSMVQPHQKSSLFPEQRTQPIFRQIASLVELCHRCGLYFRDFRLKRFVFTNKDMNKIRLSNVLDLCVGADTEDDAMSVRHVCPAYVAPEVLDMNNATYAGRNADVWALGIMLFILLTGRYPFYDSNPAQLFRRIKARRFSCLLNENVSQEAKWLFYSILRPNPSERPTAAEILCAHWLQMDQSALPRSSDTVKAVPQTSSRTAAPAVTTTQTQTPSPPAFVRVAVQPQQTNASQRAQPSQLSVSQRDATPSTETFSGKGTVKRRAEDQLVPDFGNNFSRVENGPAGVSAATNASPRFRMASPTNSLSPQSHL